MNEALTIKEAADKVGIPESALIMLVQAGSLKIITRADSEEIYVDKSEFNRWRGVEE